MADSSEKPIEQVNPGDRVMSRNPQTGKTEAKQVVRTFVHQHPGTLTLTFSGERITTEQERPLKQERHMRQHHPGRSSRSRKQRPVSQAELHRGNRFAVAFLLAPLLLTLLLGAWKVRAVSASQGPNVGPAPSRTAAAEANASPLPAAGSAQDMGFHPVQVQKREIVGDTVVLTCRNPATGKTEVITGRRGRDNAFVLADPSDPGLPTGEIQSLHPGNLVATRDPETGRTDYRRVTRTFQHLARETITARLADAHTGHVVDTLTATPEHPFVHGRGGLPFPNGQPGTLPGRYNQEWTNWISDPNNANADVFDIIDKGVQMIDRHGLGGLPIVQYK